MTRMISLAVAVAAVFIVSLNVNAGGPMPDMDMVGASPMMGMRGDIERSTIPRMNRSCRTPEYYLRHSDLLGLSSDQLDKMEALYYDLKRDMIEGGAKVKVLELDLTEIVSKPDFDLDTALDAMTRVESARTTLRSSVLKAAAAARDILTPEQLEVARDIRPGSKSVPEMERSREPSDTGEYPDDMKRRMMEKKMKERMGAPGY